MPSVAVASRTVSPSLPPQMTDRDRAVGDMRGFLARTRPQSSAEALRFLRNAYPTAPLSLRVAACSPA